MTLIDTFTHAVEIAWLLIIVAAFTYWIAGGLRPYFRRWARRRGRRGALPAQVFQIADFRRDNENAPARVRVARSRPTRSNPS